MRTEKSGGRLFLPPQAVKNKLLVLHIDWGKEKKKKSLILERPTRAKRSL
jgi:hypothetical protein